MLGDLERLLDAPIDDGMVVAGKGLGRLCIALWDCAAARSYLPSIERMKADSTLHHSINREFAVSGLTSILSDPWNVLDGEDLPKESIYGLHYTDMSTNPGFEMGRRRIAAVDQGREHWCDAPIREHKRPDLVQLWYDYFDTAGVKGYRVSDYVPETRDYRYEKSKLTDYVSRDRLV